MVRFTPSKIGFAIASTTQSTILPSQNLQILCTHFSSFFLWNVHHREEDHSTYCGCALHTCLNLESCWPESSGPLFFLTSFPGMCNEAHPVSRSKLFC